MFMKRKISLIILIFGLVLISACATHTHDWEEATCYQPRTCKICKATEGEPLEHVWLDATCTQKENWPAIYGLRRHVCIPRNVLSAELLKEQHFLIHGLGQVMTHHVTVRYAELLRVILLHRHSRKEIISTP